MRNRADGTREREAHTWFVVMEVDVRCPHHSAVHAAHCALVRQCEHWVPYPTVVQSQCARRCVPQSTSRWESPHPSSELGPQLARCLMVRKVCVQWHRASATRPLGGDAHWFASRARAHKDRSAHSRCGGLPFTAAVHCWQHALLSLTRQPINVQAGCRCGRANMAWSSPATLLPHSCHPNHPSPRPSHPLRRRRRPRVPRAVQGSLRRSAPPWTAVPPPACSCC